MNSLSSKLFAGPLCRVSVAVACSETSVVPETQTAFPPEECENQGFNKPDVVSCLYDVKLLIGFMAEDVLLLKSPLHMEAACEKESRRICIAVPVLREGDGAGKFRESALGITLSRYAACAVSSDCS
jgi:hypothetical protein